MPWFGYAMAMDGRCNVCPRRCDLGRGPSFCGGWELAPDGPRSRLAGRVASWSIDPIEKKPVWYYRSGTRVLSLGTWGCTLRCRHCLNADLAWTRGPGGGEAPWTPEDVVRLAREHDCAGIAWTTTEAAPWWTFVVETSRAMREAGGYTVLVTNGFYTAEALADLLPWLDVWRVDLKAWDEDAYRTLMGTDPGLQPAATARERTLQARQAGAHVEIVTCLVPGHHDTIEPLTPLADWIHDALGPDTPWHLLRFHPQHLMRHTPPFGAGTARHLASALGTRGLTRVHVGGEATKNGPATSNGLRAYDWQGPDGRFLRLVADPATGRLSFVGDEDLLEQVLASCRAEGLDLALERSARCG
ncbi:MAG: radical SAM protein [Candidatus Sericytochromatia bacterium]|nr:radical SAM protein [Candidatus Tanganyikabacteria bacterium]